ncbi:MAG: relaxase/mobilization nuclease domain-containing protein [Deltaproteobacteria bacterium]|jgi:hypothetical protein|nr:relaxase/mobilization nuclease domain-containing protein [Deltaproteobacteria bacterium]
MIVKKFKNQKNTKPKAQQIADIVDYIRQPHNTNPAEKIEHSGGLNFIARTHDTQRNEMTTLASETVYSKMPVSHYMFSWREGEQPTAKQVDELVDIFLREQGLEGCQTVYGLHYNTDNYHVHIAVNRMHPETMKVINPGKGFDIIACHKVAALVEHKQGWQSEAKSLFIINEAGETVRRPKYTRVKPTAAALDFECATGEKSAQRIAQDRGWNAIRDAKSWSELHDKLHRSGLRFEKKGSGAIIFVGDVAVKASSVDRDFSMGKLCKRLGEFVPGVYPAKKAKIEPEPVSWLNKEEWQHYQRVKSSSTMLDPSMGLLHARQIRERKELPTKLRQALPHPPLGAAPGPIRTCPRPILNIGRHLQKLQHKKERQQLRRGLSRWKRRLPAKPRFEDWLRDRGFNDQAEQWRHRHKLENIPSAQWEAPSLPESQQQAADPHTAYAAQRQDILQNDPDMVRSPSMLDAHIALHMRENGFKREDIVEAIQHCAPETQPEHERNWQRYAERATDYAFGVQGNLWLAKRAEERKEEQERQVAEAPQEEEARERLRLRFR